MNLILATVAAAALQATPQEGPARVTVEPARIQVEVDASVQASARAVDAGGDPVSGVSLQWFSTDPGVASVAADGTVTGVAPGRARIAARAGSAVGFATVVVPQLPASRLELVLPPGPVPAGASAPLTVRAWTRLGDRVTPSGVRFASADESVARVDGTGRVFARAPGTTTVTATSGGARAVVPVRVAPAPRELPGLEPRAVEVRTGDVVRFRVGDLHPAWSVGGSGAQIEADAGEGVFVAEQPGTYTVTARIGERAVDDAVVTVRPREHRSELVEVGRGPISGHNSGDMWVFEGLDGRNYVYIGTFMYDWAKVWDVTDPSNPVLTDSIQLDARRINDVKIHDDRRLGILTREGASDRRNGIVLLDLSTPAHPTVLSEYRETVPGGVHNVWILSEHDLVYAAHNGTSDVHILDVSDPTAVREVGRWGLQKEGKTLHDVIVQDGYAYLSYWDDGIVMLDAGAGTHGGTPARPTFVSQFSYPVGNTHVAWRYGDYLFVGDEIFPDDWSADRPIDARGYIHVVDYSDPENPEEVARYEVPEAGAHNVWVEDDRLYVGYYQAGLRVVDVSGELRGDLYRQGREIAYIKTVDENGVVPNWSMTWGAQPFQGRIYSSDLMSGLWITRLIEERVVF